MMNAEIQSQAIQKAKDMISECGGEMDMVMAEIEKRFPMLSKDEIFTAVGAAFDLVKKDFEEGR